MKISLKTTDKKWSQMVRDRDGECLYCGRKPPYVLNAHHFMRRGVKSTRFMLENGVTLCFQHHTVNHEFSAHKTPEAFKKWFIKKYPDRYKKIMAKARQPMSERMAKAEFEQLYGA